MALPSSKQDLMTWGSMLQHEPSDISQQAKRLFRRANAAFGSGHTISGICGNAKALACVCLCLVKTNQPTCDRKAVETCLQRTSGVRARVFSNALKELPQILQATNKNSSPDKKSPTKPSDLNPNPTENKVKNPQSILVGGSSSNNKGREAMRRVVEDSRNSLLIKSSPLKRPPALMNLGNEDDELLLSPLSKKRIRLSENISLNVKPKPQRQKLDDSQTPRPQPERHSRTIHKTPLNLAIKKPSKPLCIFQSQPLFKSNLVKSPSLDLSDWNWKAELFRHHWSVDDILEWEDWNKKSIETSLA